jgi:hypothetical protein
MGMYFCLSTSTSFATNTKKMACRY